MFKNRCNFEKLKSKKGGENVKINDKKSTKNNLKKSPAFVACKISADFLAVGNSKKLPNHKI